MNHNPSFDLNSIYIAIQRDIHQQQREKKEGRNEQKDKRQKVIFP